MGISAFWWWWLFPAFTIQSIASGVSKELEKLSNLPCCATRRPQSVESISAGRSTAISCAGVQCHLFPFLPLSLPLLLFSVYFFPCVFCSFFSVFHCSPGCQRGSGCLSPWPWGTKQLHGTRSPARTLPSTPKASAAPSFQKSLWELRGPALGKAGVCRAQIPSSASGWGLGKTGLLPCCANLCFIGNKTQPVPEDYSQFEWSLGKTEFLPHSPCLTNLMSILFAKFCP